MPDKTYHHAEQPEQRRFWEHHLEHWQQSGLSQRAYCQTHLLKLHQFYYWRRRILKQQTAISFLPVTISQECGRHPQAVRIHLPNGCIIELESMNDLERIVTMVATLC